MKYTYEFSDEENTIEINKYWNDILTDLDKAESANQKKESRRHADLDSGSYISEQIKSEFENAESLKQISLSLLMKTTQAVQLNINAQISLVLKNNQIIGKEESHGTENSQIHSTNSNGTIQYKESISARESSSLLPRIYKAG